MLDCLFDSFQDGRYAGYQRTYDGDQTGQEDLQKIQPSLRVSPEISCSARQVIGLTIASIAGSPSPKKSLQKAPDYPRLRLREADSRLPVRILCRIRVEGSLEPLDPSMAREPLEGIVLPCVDLAKGCPHWVVLEKVSTYAVRRLQGGSEVVDKSCHIYP
ncbi:hypothetical protein [Xanthomonas cerealis]|uniref:hypothetical protein n=1 Tax=Xanthomonas cerealis TaxID=3390025 RepID=UPI00114D1BC4|nr:hypothetical protein [Xanthomonas translucens]UKE46217.1 hypothetical protein KHA79_13925 [Xanthomonas translucens pv. cerealis]